MRSASAGSFAASIDALIPKKIEKTLCAIISEISGSSRKATIFGCSLNSRAPGNDRNFRTRSGVETTAAAFVSVSYSFLGNRIRPFDGVSDDANLERIFQPRQRRGKRCRLFISIPEKAPSNVQRM